MHNLKPKLCHIICNQFYEPLQCSFFELCSHTEDRGDKLCKIATLLTQEIANHIDDLEVEHLPSGHIIQAGDIHSRRYGQSCFTLIYLPFTALFLTAH